MNDVSLFGITASDSSTITLNNVHFWDGGGFYKALSLPTEDLSRTAVYTAAGAAAAGVAISAMNRGKKSASNKIHIKTTIDDLRK